MISRCAAIALLLTALGPLAHGRPGLLDSSFGTQGAARVVFPGGKDYASAVAIQADGKIVIVGSASNGLDSDFAVVRLNADGSPDAGFGSGGRLLIPVGDGDDFAYAVTIDGSGRIILAGSSADTSTSARVPQFAVVRLDATGALDPTFNGSGKLVFHAFSGSSDVLKAVAVDNTGRIVIAGGTSYYPSGSSTPVNAMAVIRLLADGTADLQFGSGGGVFLGDAGEARAIALDAQQRIVAASSAGGMFAVLRLDTAGNLDPTFRGGAQVRIDLSAADDIATALAIDQSGRILIGGYTESQLRGTDFAVVRVLSDGTLDSANFGSGGAAVIPVGAMTSGDFAYALRVDSSGGILIAGATNSSTTFNHDVAIVRLLSSGALDATFASGGRAIIAIGAGDEGATAMALDASGRIVLAGTTFSGFNPGTSDDFFAMRITATGAIDGSFGSGGTTIVDVGFVGAQARAMAVQPDGKVLVTGWCSNCGAATDMVVARLTRDGALDTTFGASGRAVVSFGVNEDKAYALATDASGRVLIAGSFLVDGGLNFAVARLNADGSPDPEFGSSGKAIVRLASTPCCAEDIAYAIAVDGAGRIVVAGSSDNRFAVIRLSASGALDPAFGSGGKVILADIPPPGFIGQVNAVLIDGAGRILLGGNGNDGYIVRLASNGARDSSFGSAGVLTVPAMQISAMDFDAAGRILAAGSKPNGTNSFDMAVARITAGGALDAAFGNAGVALIPIVSGGFQEFARAVKSVAQGKILVAGDVVVDGKRQFAIARLDASGNLDPRFGNGGFTLVAPAPGVSVPYGLGLEANGEIVVAGTTGAATGDATQVAVIRLTAGELQRSDFNADARSDVLWRNASTGENYLYPMSGTTILSGEGYLRTVADLNWTVVGVGDFDGDGKADILWRHSGTGQNYIYLMNATAIVGEGFIRTVADANWRVAGVGDLDGDGKDDILWRNAVTGENYLYPMNGLTIKAGEGYLRTVPAPWQIVGVGDFDGDGKADILWRNASSGQNYLYPMNGRTIKATEGFLRTVADTTWQVAGVGDFDGDGKSDIVWRNSTSGQNYLYPMDGTAIKPTEGYLRTVADQAWQIAAVGDYDGDGKSDLLWRNSSTGQNYLYPMDGTTIKPTEGFLRTVPVGSWFIAVSNVNP